MSKANEAEDPVILPVGTRIIFTRTLQSGPDDYGPGNHYATRGDGGIVTGHDCKEGHRVKWDGWPTPFGAVYGKEFKENLNEC